MDSGRRGRRDAGFTLIEVIIALAILALAAVVLLDRRLDVVRQTARARDMRTAWTLAADRLAELEMDKTLWVGPGAQRSGDFSDKDGAFKDFTWECTVAREAVQVEEFPQQGEKPREIYRLVLLVAGPSLDEPIRLEALFPVRDAEPAQQPKPGSEGPPK